MANPQPDKFTKISNELLEALCRTRIPGEARQMLDVILRLTYGFKKKKAQISLTTFSRMTGMIVTNCVRSLKKLQDMNIIIANKSARITEYEIQKNYEKWTDSIKSDSIKSDTENSIKSDTETVSKVILTYINKENYKESIKDREENFLNSLKAYLSEYDIKLLDDFYRYWSEPNKSKTKMRFELESTWDLSRRLKTWERNEKKWRKNGNGHYNTTAEGLTKIAIKHFGEEIRS